MRNGDDYAIAVVGAGGKSDTQLDATVGSSGIGFSSVATGTQTYALGSDQTGGSSGGPWLTAFTVASGDGTLTSVNSYTYRSIKNVMHGPKFDSQTQAVLAAANAGGPRIERHGGGLPTSCAIG